MNNRLGRVLLLTIALAVPVRAAEDATPSCRLPPHTPTAPQPKYIGAWETVIPAKGSTSFGPILGMQTVHNAMLPSGKVLMVSGSSWRNLAPIEYYPDFDPPATPHGIFKRDEDPFAKSKLAWYYQLVNNAAIYDPVTNLFYRVPSPVPQDEPSVPDHFAPNDLFCTGQQHLPDGNVLFTGGTQYYYPFRTGNRSTWIFDWKKELTIDWARVDWRKMPPAATDPWIFSGFMKRGRWYATPVPLLDGRLAIFSGFVGFDPPADTASMYQFEINKLVELFDPAAFNRATPQDAWRAVDVSQTPNSPYTVLINPNFKPTPGTPSCTDATPEGRRCLHDNQYDAFKLYPENYVMPDGRVYLTREGDWVSLRTCDTAFMRRTKNTYWATIGGSRTNPSISFDRGPDRPVDVSSYGTSLVDPNSNDISILGGQPTSPGVLYPLNSDKTTHFAGGRGSRKIETFRPSPAPGGGTWTLDTNFLGDELQDDRTMHYAIILPTKQVLVINGGNFDFYGPVFTPILLTPEYSAGGAFTAYKKELMGDAVEPRHYHNSAMLLPNGKILVSGGNTARATVRSGTDAPWDPATGRQPLPDLSLVDIDMYFFNDGPMAKGQKGMLTSPTENWTAEIYSPPYLFIDPDRQASIAGLTVQRQTPYTFRKTTGGKTFYLLHSGDTYRVNLDSLPPRGTCTDRQSLVLIKLPSATHGWENGQRFFQLPVTEVIDAPVPTLEFTMPSAQSANLPPAYYMLFYVDCHGKPSEAQMVRFDNAASEP